MDRQEHNGDQRLEGLLALWADQRAGRLTQQCLSLSRAAALADGAEDATAREHLASCPACARLVGRFEGQVTLTPPEPATPAARPLRFARLAPLAAAMILVAVAVALLAGAHQSRRQAAQELAHARALAGAAPAVAEAMESLRAQLRDARAETDRLSRAELASSQALRDAQQELALARQAAQDHAGQLAAQDRRHRSELADMRGELENLRDNLTAERAAHADALRDRQALHRRLAELERQGETLALRLDGQRLRLGQDRAQREVLMQLRPVRQPRVDAGLLALLQSAARSRRLAERAAQLRPAAPTPELRDLLGRLEAVLTRLDLAGPEDLFEQRWLVGVLGADLPDRLDAVLSADDAAILTEAPADAPPLPAELRGLLAEAHALLLGGACVG